MPLLLSGLPDDTLAMIAERIVRRGEAYWFAATCRAARTAVRAACTALEIDHPTTYLWSVYTSLPRLRAGMRMSSVSTQLLANSAVRGAENLPRSLDSHYTWTPLGCRSLIAGASVDVLNYVWPQWAASTNHRDPVCALLLIARANRVDLLQEMYGAVHIRNMGGRHVWSLQRMLLLALQGHPPARSTVVNTLFTPIVQCSRNIAAAQWLYNTLEEASEQQRDDQHWRRWLSNPHAVGPIVQAACKSASPEDSLRMLTNWFMPRFASRAPTDRAASTECIVQWVLLALASGGVAAPTRHHVWRWLADAWPLGLAHLLRHVHENGWRVETDFAVPVVHRNCFRVHDVATYEWMRQQIALRDEGWMYAAAWCDPCTVTWTTSKELHQLKSGLEMHRANDPRFKFAYHVFSTCLHPLQTLPLSKQQPRVVEERHVGEARQTWAQARELVIEAFADYLMYAPAEIDCTTCARPMLEISLHAFATSFILYYKRCEDKTFASKRLYDLMPLVLMKMGLTPLGDLNLHVGNGTLDDSDDEDQKSAAFEHISGLRKVYNHTKTWHKHWNGKAWVSGHDYMRAERGRYPQWANAL